MIGFARNAPWLRNLFTPSEVPSRYPGTYSPEVNLVQPYDGGGFPLPAVGSWSVAATNAAAAAATISLLVVGAEDLVRLLAVSFFASAGVLPTAHARVVGPVGEAVGISENQIATVTGEHTALQVYTPIIPAGHTLQLRYYGGDVLTVVVARAFVATVPRGTVFYV